jgi:hypothetical protein
VCEKQPQHSPSTWPSRSDPPHCRQHSSRRRRSASLRASCSSSSLIRAQPKHESVPVPSALYPVLVFDPRMPVAAAATDLTGLEFRLALSLEAPEPREPPLNQLKVE